METAGRFQVVFLKLQEALRDQPADGRIRVRIVQPPDITAEELESFEGIRRAVLEVSEPEPTSYTTT